MVFDRKTCVIPDETRFDEHMIQTKGDVVVGDRSLLQFGITTEGRIFVGEHAVIDGDLHATNDIRVDIFSIIGGDISSGGNTYLGEKVTVKGKLSLAGDLDVGDNVNIEKGFEAKGWINIRSPIPIVIYIFIYLTQLLRLGRSDEIERILAELEQSEGDTIPVSETFLFVPSNSLIGNQKSQVDGNFHVGKHCKIIGNYEIRGNGIIDDDSIFVGTLNVTGNMCCGNNVDIQGNILVHGEVTIGEGAHIGGSITAEKIHVTKTVQVDGTLLAKTGVVFVNAAKKDIPQEIHEFEKNIDMVKDIEQLLE